MLKYAFGTSTDGIYLHTRSDWFYNMDRLKAKTKIRKVLIRDRLFVDDEAVIIRMNIVRRLLLPGSL